MDAQGTEAATGGADPEPRSEIPTPASAPAPPAALAGTARARRRGRAWSSSCVAGFVIRVPYTTIAPGRGAVAPSRVTVQGAQAYPGGARRHPAAVRARGEPREPVAVRAGAPRLRHRSREGRRRQPGQAHARATQRPGSAADGRREDRRDRGRVAGRRLQGRHRPGRDRQRSRPRHARDRRCCSWGDVICRADGHKIAATSDLTAAIAKHKVGDEVTLVVVRAGKRTDGARQGRVFPTAPSRVTRVSASSVSPRFTLPVEGRTSTRPTSAGRRPGSR